MRVGGMRVGGMRVGGVRSCGVRSCGPREVRRRVQLRRPPEFLARDEGEGRNEHGAHEQGVDQHTDADDDTNLSEGNERQDPQHREDGGQQDAGARDDAARRGKGADHALRGSEHRHLDRLALERMSAILTEAASSLEFFESSGTRGMPPSGALAARVDAAIDAAETTIHDDNSHGVAAALTALAQTARDVGPGAKEAQDANRNLSNFLERLSKVVAKQLGHVGEARLTF